MPCARGPRYRSPDPVDLHAIARVADEDVSRADSAGVINRSPKPSRRITLDIRVIIARVFDPISGDDHPYITR